MSLDTCGSLQSLTCHKWKLTLDFNGAWTPHSSWLKLAIQLAQQPSCVQSLSCIWFGGRRYARPGPPHVTTASSMGGAKIAMTATIMGWWVLTTHIGTIMTATTHIGNMWMGVCTLALCATQAWAAMLMIPSRLWLSAKLMAQMREVRKMVQRWRRR